jgi:hypothetical protein
MAEVNSKVDLVGLRDLKGSLALLHVYCDEFIADFWRMLSCVYHAELLGPYLLRNVGLNFKVNFLRLNALLPPDFVETFSKVNNKGDDGLVEVSI